MVMTFIFTERAKMIQAPTYFPQILQFGSQRPRKTFPELGLRLGARLPASLVREYVYIGGRVEEWAGVEGKGSYNLSLQGLCRGSVCLANRGFQKGTETLLALTCLRRNKI